MSGNVGIGSTSPLVSLDLSQKVDALALPVGTNGGRPIGGNLVNGEIRYNSSIPGLEAYVNGGWSNIMTSTVGTSAPEGSGTANYVARWTGTTTLGTGTLYDNGSSVGIGTTSPASLLDIYAGTTYTYHFRAFDGTASRTVGIYNPAVSNSLPIISFKQYGTPSNQMGLVFNTTPQSYTDAAGGVAIDSPNVGQLALYTTNLTAMTERMRINYSGTVGIGTSTMSASNLLEVNGAAAIGYTNTAAPTNGLLVNGNVGIGTTSPIANLDIQGGTVTTSTPVLNIAQTWNNAATTFDAPIFENITNTASNTNSKLMDLQMGGGNRSHPPLSPSCDADSVTV